MRLHEIVSVKSGSSESPVFKGTDVEVGKLFDYLLDSRSIDDFLADYEVESAKVHGLIRYLRSELESTLSRQV